MQFFCICQFAKNYIVKIMNKCRPKFNTTLEQMQHIKLRKFSKPHRANMNQCDTCKE